MKVRRERAQTRSETGIRSREALRRCGLDLFTMPICDDDSYYLASGRPWLFPADTWFRLCKSMPVRWLNLNSRANIGAFLPKRDVGLWRIASERP